MNTQTILISKDLQDPVHFEPLESAVTVWPCGHVFNEKTVTSLRERSLPCPLDRIPIQDFVINHNIRNLVKSAKNETSEPPLEQAVALYKEAKKLKNREEYANAASLFLQASNLSPNYSKAKLGIETCLNALKGGDLVSGCNSFISHLSQIRLEKSFYELSKNAQLWLRICSYFDHSEIPVSYLESLLTNMECTESKEDILNCLSASGFIERDGELLFMHRYVHDTIGDIEDGSVFDLAYLILTEEWDIDEESNSLKESKWTPIWVKHVVAFMKHPSFGQSDLPDLQLFSIAIGQYFFDKDEFKKAISFFEKAVQTQIKFRGESSPEVTEILETIGDCHFNLDEYQEAIPYYEKVLAAAEAVGDNYSTVAEISNSIAECYFYDHAYEDAFLYYKKFLQVSEKILGENSEELIPALTDVAKGYEYCGKYSESVEVLNRKFEILKGFKGEDHTATVEAQKEIIRLEEFWRIIREASE